jgi:hypothetical protein
VEARGRGGQPEVRRARHELVGVRAHRVRWLACARAY